MNRVLDSYVRHITKQSTDALAKDYAAMLPAGMLLDEDESFDTLMQPVRRDREEGERGFGNVPIGVLEEGSPVMEAIRQSRFVHHTDLPARDMHYGMDGPPRTRRSIRC